MKAFVITPDDNITAYATRALARASLTEGAVVFASQAELAKYAAHWPTARLLQIWNSIPGLPRKFTDRKTGLARIWKAIQSLEPAPDPAPRQPRARSAGPSSKPDQAEAPSASSKRAEVIALMRCGGGATLQEIMTKTGWQAHTVRGFVSGTLVKKLGLPVESFKNDKAERAYRIAPQRDGGAAET